MKPSKRLAEHLERVRLNQHEFALVIGISAATVCRILQGTTPSLRAAVAIEREAGIPCSAWVD